MFSSNTSAASDFNYIEDVFSTWLYTGNGSTQTITNGIDLLGKGGLVWLKSRSAATNNFLFDTARGVQAELNSNTTDASTTLTSSLISFGSSGFTLGSAAGINTNGDTYTSWTFRKQPKFFDVVTYTGNGVNGRAIAHALGAVPGCVIIKRTDTTLNWAVYHRSAGGQLLTLNTTDAAGAIFTPGNFGNGSALVTPTDSVFSVANLLNTNGGTYVAYLFAHDAGGFGLTGTDNVISCGSYTGTGSTGLTVNLGYEPQWLMIKAASNTGNWWVIDNMRGFVAPPGSSSYLVANSSAAEIASSLDVNVTSTGFVVNAVGTSINSAGGNYIYIAIRRGPMKTPTTGTSVFSPIAANNSTGTKNTTNFPVDLQINTQRTNSFDNRSVVDRLRGVSSNSTEVGNTLYSNTTGAEFLNSFRSLFWDNTGFQTVSYNNAAALIYWNFRRAPGFFDVVCYTGTGVARTVNHNLGVAPELMIVKRRNNTSDWVVYSANLGNTKNLRLQTNFAVEDFGSLFWNSTSPTATVFSLGTGGTNVNAGTYVAYLFATVAGVSKVGSYTGNGTSLTVNCGFTGGARFVLIKRTDSTGDWVVFDSARGIVAGNDPFLELNTTAAEQTGQDAIDPDSTGFIVNQTAENLNVSGGQYIFLAIA